MRQTSGRTGAGNTSRAANSHAFSVRLDHAIELILTLPRHTPDFEKADVSSLKDEFIYRSIC